MPHALLDASALVALFDINDRHHTTCKNHLRTAQKQGRHLITTWPCVTEASYLLSPLSHTVMLRWLSAAVMVDNLSVTDLPAMADYMEQYTEPRKTLADFADVSLVWLAHKLNSTTLISLDHRDFARYRLPDGRAFDIWGAMQ